MATPNPLAAVQNAINDVNGFLSGSDWRRQWRAGSYKGIPFFIESHELSGGNRNVVHEFPQKNTPYTQPLGRKARAYTLELYVLGDDVWSQRDAMIAACEDGFESGDLVHPYFKETKKVFVDDFRVFEDKGNGRVAKFTITFREEGSPDFPSSTKDGPFALLQKAIAVKNAVSAAFQTAYQVTQLPGDLIDFAKAQVGSFTASVTASLQGIQGNATALANMTTANAALSASASLATGSIVGNPSSLFTQVSSILDQIGGVGLPSSDRVVEDDKDALLAYSRFYEFGDDDAVIPETTLTRIQQKEAMDAFNVMVKSIAVSNACVIAADTDFSSFQEAKAEQDRLTLILDSLIERDGIDDELYNQLNNTRGELVLNVPESSPDLPRLLEVTLPESMTALTLAYALYADIEREQEIIDRNVVENPNIVPGGVVLEVLNQ